MNICNVQRIEGDLIECEYDNQMLRAQCTVVLHLTMMHERGEVTINE